MFSNLKKKIEAEVGDLSRLNLRSITGQSEKMTPLSSRHNSVSSLTSDSYTPNNKQQVQANSPLSPLEETQHYFSGGGANVGGGNKGDGGGQQKIKRQFEEKIQTLELDFAWRLSAKDEDIAKLQKQVDHLNNLLQSKEFETQQKLIRVHEDMDSLEGFSQQENAKIKHLLLNREEELSQLRAAVMFKDLKISEFENQLKVISGDNERLQKNLDEVVGRGVGQNSNNKKAEIESENRELVLRISELESRCEELQKDNQVLKEINQAELETLRRDISTAEAEKRKCMLQMSEFESRCGQLEKENKSLKETHKVESEALLTRIASLERDMESEKQKCLIEISEAQSRCNKLEEENVVLRNTPIEQDKEVELLRRKVSNLERNFESENRDWVLKVSELQSRCEELKKDNQVLKENNQAELEALRGDISTAEAEKLEYMLQMSELETRCGQLEEENVALRNTPTEKEEVEVLRRKLLNLETNFESENRDWVQKISKLQSRCDKVETENQVLKETNQAELEALIRNVSSLEAEKRDVMLKFSEFQSSCEQLEKENRTLKEANQKELEVLHTRISSLEKDMESEKQELLLKVSDAQSRCKEFEEENTVLREASSDKEELEALRRKVLNLEGDIESENRELVLQISEIQSRCDELEEENKFLKENPVYLDDLELLRRKTSNLEVDLQDKNQTIKQQSLQLQDLRRSLAKEINKNQALSETASPIEMSVPQSQCNGGGAMSNSSSSIPLTSSPPTLPPQETDVNFMYLRSVLFKYLTTTDSQVTHQLTKVVATLLHLNEEESHSLSQATENRNSFFHLLSKS